MMIQLTLREDDPMTDFIEARAAQLQRDRTEIAQFMAGEISQGRMAEELGIGRADLIHLLERLELAVTNL
jgi:hypothetical protein